MLKKYLLKIIKEIDITTTEAIYGSYYLTRQSMWDYVHRPSWKSKERLAMEQKIKDYEKEQIEKQRFYSLLSSLHRDGLIEKTENKFWRLTSKGNEKLKRMLSDDKNKINPLQPIDDLKKDFLKVIVFDIPEKDKNKRVWIRQTLRNFDFSMLQKSVWVGENKLSEEFFKTFRSLKLLPYVHVFAVKKKGSIGIN